MMDYAAFLQAKAQLEGDHGFAPDGPGCSGWSLKTWRDKEMNMSKQTHTPGPWHRNIRANGKYPVVFAGRNTHVATAAQFPQNPEETEANIDLIAAAPELLAALENLISLAEAAMRNANYDGACYAVDEELREGRTAVAKATGAAK